MGAKDTVDWQMTQSASSPNIYLKEPMFVNLVPTTSIIYVQPAFFLYKDFSDFLIGSKQ